METELNRRHLLSLAAAIAIAPTQGRGAAFSGPTEIATGCGDVEHLPVSLDIVPFPRNIAFTVRYGEQAAITLQAHYWYNAEAMNLGRKCPAIVELNPYRRRDGLMYTDSMMYPWFAANEYLCFRVDLHGSGDSEGVITDEYTDEELSYCVQVVEQIAELPICDGNVGMMGKSWSAINSLMVSARADRPRALKAIVVCAGTDDRYNDDVHYMGGAMMLDNIGWPSDIWGWLALPPDPAVVGERWRELWRERIRNMSFWFEQWGGHQSRDSYWSRTSVREQYDQVTVPVFVLSGWQDGYKNAIERVVRALGGRGRPVSGLLGPWGHKYPFDGYPGPRIDWLRYVVTHWWDRWLKGRQPDPETTWPELVVWLGESRPPARAPSFDDAGHWVAEDHAWMDRTRDKPFYLSRDHLISPEEAISDHVYASGPDLTLGSAALETSSWGECTNEDLPGDTSLDDRRSISFDSEPLAEDLACFGYPEARLNLECDKPLGAVAIRLCELSPGSGETHLVTYGFFNLCYRGGDMADPRPVTPGPFAVRVPLNIIGHVFKRGWKLRLSISPFYFPTLWASPEMPTVRLHTGPVGDLPASLLMLPGRDARFEDARAQALLGVPRTAYVDPEPYVPTLETVRAASSRRTTEPMIVHERSGVLVHKVFDSGSTRYGGPLDGLLVDQVVEENALILDGDPLSAAAFTRSASTLTRRDWHARAVTGTRVWSEKTPAGEIVFRYEAEVQTFIGDTPFEDKRVAGTIPRRWV